MKNRTLFFALYALSMTVVAGPLSGCNYLRAREARNAYGEYQAAMAQGNMKWAQSALTRLVHIEQDVPDYWIELANVDLQLGDFREAYDAFSRAHELDRTNVTVLAMLTRLALVSGQTQVAEDHARTLALLDPNNAAVSLVQGYAALHSGDFDKADANADAALAQTPDDSSVKILKARILIARGRTDDAISLLESQHRAAPRDRSSIRALRAIYRDREDWRNMARVLADLHQLDRSDDKATLMLVEGRLRSGDIAGARADSERLLSPAASPQQLDAILATWARFATGRPVPDSSRLAAATQGDRRVSFASYFNRIGKPAEAAALLGNAETPVRHSNVRWNAVFAQALALQGRSAEARKLFDQVLDTEPDQIDALRGRSALRSRLGMHRDAIVDALRLVSLSPGSGEDRLVLARAYLAAGNRSDVRRTLWQAFQDLPDDERIFAALRSVLVSTGDLDGQQRLKKELADQRVIQLTKELI